jgi:hypothetical protein
MTELISYREYARRKGVTLKAVQKAIDSGRITTTLNEKGQPKIDPAIADQQWESNTNPAKRQMKIEKAPVHSDSDDASEDALILSLDDNLNESEIDYSTSRALREYYDAKLRKLEYLQKAGELVNAKDLEHLLFERGRIIREALESIPARVANLFAAETDSTKILQHLTKEIQMALEGLKNVSQSRNSS